ncbi:MAG: tape measure protein [Bacteroidales bacterium]
MNNEKGKLYFGLGLDNDQLRADALESRNIIKGIGDSTAAEGARIDNAYRKIAGTVAAVFTVQQAAVFAQSIVQVRGEIESLEISFETLLGNKQKANALFSDIKTYAVNTPMQMNDLAKGAQMLLSFNVEAERVMPILKQIGDISMGDAQKFNSLTLAFSQMLSTGKLMGQDLLQMISAGFNPLSVISEKTGKSIGVLKKEMEGGLITSKMVADAFASATSEGGKFYGMLDKQSKGINGSMSNLTGAITDMFNDLGTENQEFITDTIQGATTVVKHYKEIGEAIAIIVATYGTYKAAIIATEAVRKTISTIKHTEEAAELMKLLTVEQQAKISKLGLAKTSLEYSATVQAEVASNVQAAQTALTKARADVVAANQTVVARREEYVAAKQLESQRLAELMSIGATGSAKQVEAAQRKLSAAEMQRESSALAFQSATRDFNAKKTVVETAARTANTTATAANTAVQTANVTATSFLSLAKTRLTAVAAKLNAVIMANPYALAAAAVIALGYGIYKLVTYQTDAEKAQQKLNDAIKETNKNIDSEVHQIDAMFARLKNAKQGTDEYRAAKEAIMRKHGEQLKKLGDEKNALNDIAAAYKLITEEAKKAARARAMESFTKDAADTLAEKEGGSKDEVRELLDKKYKGKKGSDGISLSETYYWKIKPVIEGESEITPEIEKILKEFDKVGGYMSGGSPMFGGGTWVSTVSNSIKDEINKAAKARGIYGKVMSEAQMKFGENPNANAPEAPKFDATTASLQQLMEQLPKAKDELDALKKADKPDPAVIAAKEQEVQQIKDQTAAREKSVTAIKDVKAQIELLQKEQEKYGKDDTEYTALETRIKSLKTKLPQTEGQANKTETDAARIKRETAERNEKIKEYEDAVKKQVKQSELDIAQARIDAMEDGYAKEQAQNDIAYKRLVLANQQREMEMVKALQDARELEWENKNPKAKANGETFDRSTVTAADLSPEQKMQLTEFYKVAENIRDKANQDSLVKMLDDFLTYEQQRNKIAEEYAKKRQSMQNKDGSFKAGFTQGNVDELNRSEDEALKAVDETFAMREETFQAWMNAVANMSLKQLERVLKQAERDLKNLEKKSGVDSKQVAAARAKVNTARTKVSKAKADNDVAPGKRSVKEWEDLYKTLQEVEREFENIGNTIGGVAGEVISTAGQVAGSSLSMINGIVQLVNMSSMGMQATAVGAATAISTVEKASIILTIISAAMQIAMTIINLFNNDKAYQKEIENLQGRVDQLQWELDNADAIRLQSKSFNVLQKIKELYAETTREVLKLHAANNQYGNAMIMLSGRAIYQNEIMQKSAEKLAAAYANISYTADKALGSEKFSGAKDQLKNIAEQQLLMQEQIRNEDAKKKTDHGKIEEWERQIQELGVEANKIINEIVEDIIGESAADLAAELGDALIEAFQNGEDAVEAWGDKVNEVVANVMKRMLVSKFLEEPLGEIFDKYKSKWYKDGEFAGIDSIIASMGGFANDLNSVGSEFQAIWENLPDDIKNMFAPTDETREASQKGIASASQESVDELNGRMTAVQGHTSLLAENSKMLVVNSNKILNHLAGIEDNTKSLARLEQIETDMGAVKNTLSDIALKGIKIK